MKVYRGKKSYGGVGGQRIVVRDNGEEYPLEHIERHSPKGFNWGYEGSGPADSALAILTDCLGMDKANQLYQLFKREFVASWGEEWSITQQEILEWVKKQKKNGAS